MRRIWGWIVDFCGFSVLGWLCLIWDSGITLDLIRGRFGGCCLLINLGFFCLDET